MDEKVYPAEPVFAEQMAALSNRWAWTQTPIMSELTGRAGPG
jgi:acyl-CoA dehydrogenase